MGKTNKKTSRRNPEISIVITSFNEPKTIGKAIKSFLDQDLLSYELIVSAPDKPTLEVAKRFQKRNSQIKLFKDPGKGKSYALNLLLPKLKGEIIILSDGDCFVSPKSVYHLLQPFKSKKVGCVTGRPVSLNKKDNMFGFWSHLLCDAGAHTLRLKRHKKCEFIECSGYLWAFRNNVIKKFPLDVAEDTIVPILFHQKGYQIAYAPEAKVFVKYPDNLKEFIEQKKRTSKAHLSLEKHFDLKKIPRMKTFKGEVLGGPKLFFYPKKIKEFFWILGLFPTRLYIWALSSFQSKIQKKHYSDGWKRIESTK